MHCTGYWWGLIMLFFMSPVAVTTGQGISFSSFPAQDNAMIVSKNLFCESYVANSLASALYQERGSYHLADRQYSQAVLDYRKALQLNPGSFETYGFMGEALVQQGLLTEAMEAFDRAIELNPFYADAYFHRANLFLSTDHYKEAYEDYTIAAYIDPVYLHAFRETNEKDLSLKRLLKNELKALDTSR